MRKNIHIKLGKALYKSSKKANSEKEIFENLEILEATLADPEIFSKLAKLAYVEETKLLSIIDEAFEKKLNQVVVKLMALLIGNQKLQLFSKIVQVYKIQYFEDLNIKDVKLITSREMDDDEVQQLLAKLFPKDKGKIHAEVETNPKLIGGLQVYAKGRLFDLSIRNYLEMLKNHLRKQETI